MRFISNQTLLHPRRQCSLHLTLRRIQYWWHLARITKWTFLLLIICIRSLDFMNRCISWTGEQGTHRSPVRPQIIDFHMILVKTNLISGGYVSSTESDVMKQNNVIFSLPTFTVPTGSKLIERPQTLTWLPVIQQSIQRIQIEVIDENGNLIDFGNEEVSIVLVIRQI